MAPKALSDERVQDSSDDESIASDAQTKSPSINIPADKVLSDSDNDSDSSSKSGSSNASSRNSTSKRKAPSSKRVAEPSPKKAKQRLNHPRRVDAPSFVPPTGYSKTSTSSKDDTFKATSLFSDLEGKQVWHITVPDSMPISKLTTFDTSAGLRGQPVFEHKGIQYSLSTRTNDSAALLLPRGKDISYVSSSAPITHHYIIREMAQSQHGQSTEREDDETDREVASLAFFATKTGELIPPRKQPMNLNGRFIPYGVKPRTAEADEAIDGDTMEVDFMPKARSKTLVHRSPASSKDPSERSKSVPKTTKQIDPTSSAKKKRKELTG